MNSVTELKTHQTTINYKLDEERILKFLLFFAENDTLPYLAQLKSASNAIQINLEDILLYDESDLVQRIEHNAMSYLNMFYRVIDNVLYNDSDLLVSETDDVFFYHRISRFKQKFPSKRVTDVFPSFLLRNYTIFLLPRRNSKVFTVRTIKAQHIGQLLRVSGIVTRVSQVKPSIKVATYICESCGTETYQQINSDLFDLLEECGSEKCKTRKIKGTLVLVTRGSKFVKHQTLQIQELGGDVPHGCVPRLMNIECYAVTTELCRPGDVVISSGIFLPKPYAGYKKIRAGLLTDTYLCATNIECMKQNRGDMKEPSEKANMLTDGSNPRMEKNAAHIEDNNLFEGFTSTSVCSNTISNDTINLFVSSVAPEIYGLTDVKKIILLMLIGAPPKVRHDGMRIRGDMNVLIVGDPGIAKSQLLKTAVKISRRGVYTTGKGSSGVGLTASVAKDPITGEMILEGGALVLSDMGICCIDELDKMGEVDRVSIHEVMEQQSVSVSKAGINTTLNARCAVLGAANPIKGRYNPKKSVEYNVGLPCALLSRFDVLVVLKDEPNFDEDLNLANHITSLHLKDESKTISYGELRAHIEEAKKHEPVLPKHLSEKLSKAYVEERRTNSQTTPRYLLALIRLTLAHCRLRLSSEVNEDDVYEALRLMENMKVPVIKARKEVLSPKRAIYKIIMDLNREDKVPLESVWEATRNKYTREEVEDVISEFASCGIWIRTNEELIIYN